MHVLDSYIFILNYYYLLQYSIFHKIITFNLYFKEFLKLSYNVMLPNLFFYYHF
jgi:hypothetical protein